MRRLALLAAALALAAAAAGLLALPGWHSGEEAAGRIEVVVHLDPASRVVGVYVTVKGLLEGGSEVTLGRASSSVPQDSREVRVTVDLDLEGLSRARTVVVEVVGVTGDGGVLSEARAFPASSLPATVEVALSGRYSWGG